MTISSGAISVAGQVLAMNTTEPYSPTVRAKARPTPGLATYAAP